MPAPQALVRMMFRLVLPIALLLTLSGPTSAQPSISQIVDTEQGDGYELRYV